MAAKYSFFILILFNIYCAEINSQNVYPVEFVTRIGTPRNKYGWQQAKPKLLLSITCIVPFKPVVYPRDNEYDEIQIRKCKIPNVPLVTQLTNSKIETKNLKKLQFTDSLADPPFPLNYTAGLSINALEISNVTNFVVSPEFFTPMEKLRELTFENINVPILPPSMSLPLEALILKYAPIKNWDNCEFLQILHIEGLSKEQIPKEWPTNCSHLKTIMMESISVETVQHLMSSMNESSIMKLETLKIRNCSLKQLPLHLMQSESIECLDLSNNILEDNLASLQFPKLVNLKVLDLSNNKISVQLLSILPKRTPALRELYIGGIKTAYEEDFERFQIRESLVKLSSLEIIDMERVFEDKSLLQHYRFKNLKYLNIRRKYSKTYSGINHLKLHGFPSTGAKELTVDMRGLGNEVNTRYVSIGPDFVESFDPIYERSTRFWLTNKGYKLTVLMDSVDCDCKNDVLRHALAYFPHFLAIPKLKCSHGGLFVEEPMENLSCKKATVNGCLRKMTRGADYTTVVDCNNNTEKFRWPRPKGFRKLAAVGNNIYSLDKAYLPDSLMELDLRNNSLSRLSAEQASRLFGNKGRLVWLAGNPIICDCDNQPFLYSLHVNQSLIMDYDILTCVDSGKLLRSVSIDELCRLKSIFVLLLVSVLALLTLVLALLIRHYWSTLRMILYAHGCCISCLREKDSDDDRPYDAFLSFAHEDDQYVMKKLLPQLEGGPNFYRLCVHYRDWAVGEWIPAQILQSVRLSKRTIIVLSKNFLRSCWGMLEFRHANASAMADGRQRLLVLILDDVLSEEMSPEIQGYLELNTYLKCNDPWFWEKLQYAMPHKDGKQSRQKRHFENTGKREIALNDLATRSDEESWSVEIVEITDNSEI